MPNKSNILLIEDNPDDQFYISEVLSGSGFEEENITAVDTLGQGLEILNGDLIDLILLDLSLPDSFGLEGLNKIRKNYPKVPIIMLTGLNDNMVALDAIKNGAQDYLIKGKYTNTQLEKSIRYAMERKQAQERLQQSEKQYRTLFEKMNEGLVIMDLEGKIELVNEQFAKLAGYSSKELISVNFYDLLVGSEDNKKCDQYNVKKDPGSTNKKYEVILKRKDGKQIWIGVSPSERLDEQGKINGCTSIISDISTRKEAELKEKVVYNIAQKSNSRLTNIEFLAKIIHDQINRVVNTENMYLAIYDKELKKITFPYHQDEYDDLPGVAASYENRTFGVGLTDMVIETRRAHLLRDDDFKILADKYIIFGKKPKCWLGVPLTSDSVAIGAIAIQSYHNKYAFDEEDKKFLQFVAAQMQGLVERVNTHLKLIDSQQALREEHKEVLKYHSMLLGSQLNPHFIFNALSSIQNHILNTDPEPALNFLSSFSTLMRTVLKNSRLRLIPIEEEINFLKMYLDLEQSRHQDKFTYSIEVEDNIDIQDIHIPPMLLQPFVENTILHGVGNLASGGKIDIIFKTEGNNVICEILDNGVGREEAQRLKVMRKGDNVGSYSTKINQTRLDILNKLESDGYQSSIKDLTNENGKPLGTKVTVQFPLMTEN